MLRKVVLGPAVFAATAVFAFSVAPVNAAAPPQSSHAWGDIDSVVAGPGLTGGAIEGDALISVLFGGNGSASSVARSDHDHDGRYLPASANFDDRYMLKGESVGNFDDRYWLRTENFDDRYAPLGINFDDRYAPLGINFDDRYWLRTENFDDRYAPLGINFDDRYAPIGVNFDDRYLQLAGGTLTGSLFAPQFGSTAPEGTAPFQVTSSTLVPNLNADKLDGFDAGDFALASQGGPEGAAMLAGDNAFSGSNTFNGPTTFANVLGMTAGGVSFSLQPFYTSTTSYSLRLLDTRAGATRWVIDQNGRLGLGTTSPTAPLHVVGDIRASNLNLGTAFIGPTLFDMSSGSDRTLNVQNSGAGVGNLSVEGLVSAAGFAVTSGNGSARAGNDAIAPGDTTRVVATTAVGAASLIFVTPDASRAGCAPVADALYVSARSAGTSFTVAVAGPAPFGGSFCFNWWVVN